MFDGDDTVLVVGAHPDDEVLGAGGAIAKHARAGDEVHILIVTEGTTQQYEAEEDLVARKRDQARSCADLLGAKSVHFGDLPDMRLDTVAHVDVNEVIEGTCDEVDPDIVYTHSPEEVNQDHIEIYESTLVATRPGSGVSTVLSYETPSSSDFSPTTGEFEPDLFVDVTDVLDTKIEAFNEYELETRPFPHPRSPEALRSIAKTRGAASRFEAAEAFDILRAYR